MLSPEAIIRLPYTDDLTTAGIAYALRSLAYTYDRMGGSPFERLRRIAAGKAVELALRRYLDGERVPYDNLGGTPFTDPDHYDIALGGHRCDLKSFVISRRRAITQARQTPEILLDAAALVPSDQLASEHLRDNDLYIFAFLMALFAAHSSETRQAQLAGRPIYLMCNLPARWTRPGRWKTLGQLALKLECEPALLVEAGGQTSAREFISERIWLTSGQRIELRSEFFSLAYLHAEIPPHGRVGVHSPVLNETFVVEPHQWGNIYVYGMDIYLTGTITHAEFCQRAEQLPSGSNVWQYAHTRTANHVLQIGSLYSISDVLASVKAWERYKSMQTE